MTLETLKARLTAMREGYAVHVGCGGECTELANDRGFNCAACAAVVHYGVAMPKRDLTHEEIDVLLMYLSAGTP